MPTIIPLSHSFVAILEKDGKLARTRETKFAVAPGDKPDDRARAILASQFKGFNVQSVTIKALKPVKKSVKLNVQHDYLTLTAQFTDGLVRFTTSRGGYKLSGSAPRGTLEKLIKLSKSSNNVGEALRAIEAIANESTNLGEFLAAI